MFPVKICTDAKIEQEIKYDTQIKYSKILPVFAESCKILNLPVNGKNPNWFYQQIQQYQEYDRTEEFLLQSLIFILAIRLPAHYG